MAPRDDMGTPATPGAMPLREGRVTSLPPQSYAAATLIIDEARSASAERRDLARAGTSSQTGSSER